jgi:hypothetical protein
MISNSCLQINLLSFLFKKFNIIEKGINIKDTLNLYAVLFSCFIYTQRPSGFKAIIKSIFKNKFTFVNVGSLLLADYFALSL